MDAYWTGITGSGNCEWNEYYKSRTDSGFPGTEIEAHARGAVQITIDTSVSGQAEIKDQLIDCGFASVGGPVGTVYYLSKADNLDLYVDIY